MGTERWLQALDVAVLALLLLPLLQLCRAGYDGRLWWRVSTTDLLPVASPLTVSVPISAWYAAFFAVSGYAAVAALANGHIVHLALIIVAVEAGYGIWRRGRKPAPLGASAPTAVIAFALGQNALSEELLFRGVPLLFAWIGGFEDEPIWQYIFVVASASAFGVYHCRTSGRARLYDTTLYGAVLAWVAVWSGVASAILLHLTHNALAVPLNQTAATMPAWLRQRRIWLVAVFLLAGARLGWSLGLSAR